MPRKMEFPAVAVLEMIQGYAGGKSMAALARERGCGKNTVRRLFRENGVVFDKSRSLSAIKKGRPSARKSYTVSDRVRVARRNARDRAHELRRGATLSPETRARISAALQGRHRRFTDEERKSREAIRQALKRFLHRSLKASGRKKCSRTEAALGYRVGDLMAHLGPRPADAHIDHIVPIAEFFRRGIFEPAVINALQNLRWLSADENRRKSATVPENADDIIRQCLTKTNGGYAAGIAA